MIIKIKNLKIDMILGVYEFEKQKTQPVLVNLTIDFDEGDAPNSDNIKDTLNYHPICIEITEMLKARPYELVESVVEDIGKYLLQYNQVRSAYVEVDKPEAPIDDIESLSVAKHFFKDK